MKVIFSSLAKYEAFIIVGLLIVIGTSVKLSGIYDFSSDWFWLLIGVGIVVEGVISMVRQRKFDRKYKIIEVSEAIKNQQNPERKSEVLNTPLQA